MGPHDRETPVFNRSAPKESAVLTESTAPDVSTKARVAEQTHSDDDGPVVQMVTSLVSQGLRDRASDIHVEPLNDILRIRYRIDGNLVEAQTLPLHMHSSLPAIQQDCLPRYKFHMPVNRALRSF